MLEVDTDTDVIGYEPILKDGEVVGHVTSGGFGHSSAGASPSAMSGPTSPVTARAFAIDILGEERPAVLRKAALHDPNGGRLRG